jgi:hypothetical protein
VLTEAAMLEATAHSILNDVTSSTRSIIEAEKFYEQQSDELPQWASHWDQAVFSSFAGGCWINMKKPAEARPHLETAWNASGDLVRRKVFSAGQLSKLSLQEGDIDQASHYALVAAKAATKAGSKRSNKVIRELRGFLEKYFGHPSVNEFNEQATSLFNKTRCT